MTTLALDGDSVPLVLARVVTDQITAVGGFARGSVKFGGTPGDLMLSGEGVVEVETEGACIVELVDRDPSFGADVYVDGCDLRTRGTGPRGRELQSRFGAIQPTWFRVQLGPNIRFSARGR